MNRPHDVDEGTLHLIEAACDGTITADEQQQLDRAITANEAAARAYSEYFHTHSELHFLAKLQRARNAALSHMPAETHKVRRQPSWLSRNKTRNTFVIATTIFFGVLLVLSTIPAPNVVGDADKQDTPAPTVAEEIATLTGWHRIDWKEGYHLSGRDHRLRAGQKVAMLSGLAEITYDTGAKVVLEGPCEFVIGARDLGLEASEEEAAEPSRTRKPADVANSGFLQLGKLVAHVQGKAAEGFTIGTPWADVVDRGTRFGVDVDVTGATVFVVIEGKVDLETQVSGQTQPRTQRLVAGEAVQVTGGATGSVAVTSVAADSIDLTASIPKSAYDRWTESRAELLSDAIVDMDMEGNPPANSGAIEPTVDRFGKAEGAWRFGTNGPDGPYASVSLGASNRLMPSSDQPITILAWVKPEQFLPTTTENRIVTLYRSYKTTGLTLAMGGAEGGTGRLSAGYVLGERLFEVAGKRRIQAAEWYHVALTFDGESLSIYLNGTLEHTVKTELAACAPTAATVGAFERSRHGFIGAIDDVHVLDRAVSAEHINKLYETGRASE